MFPDTFECIKKSFTFTLHNKHDGIDVNDFFILHDSD
jgi:hypothetical protein